MLQHGGRRACFSKRRLIPLSDLSKRVEENELALSKSQKSEKRLSVKLSFKKQAMTVGIYRATKLKNDLNKALLAGMKQQVLIEKLEKKVQDAEAEVERVVITSASEKKALEARRQNEIAMVNKLLRANHGIWLRTGPGGKLEIRGEAAASAAAAAEARRREEEVKGDF